MDLGMGDRNGAAAQDNATVQCEVPLADIELGSWDFWARDDNYRDGAFATLHREAPISFWPEPPFDGFGRGNWGRLSRGRDFWIHHRPKKSALTAGCSWTRFTSVRPARGMPMAEGSRVGALPATPPHATPVAFFDVVVIGAGVSGLCIAGNNGSETVLMLCCLVLGGLALFGPHGVRLYQILRGRRDIRISRQFDEPRTSRHLVSAHTAARATL